MASRRTIHFPTPEVPPPPQAPAAIEEDGRVYLYKEPTAEPLVLGEMIRDARTLQEMLGRIIYESDETYRGNLRVVVSTCRRMTDRAIRLLGEENGKA